MGGDTLDVPAVSDDLLTFQSQVAILGWGYTSLANVTDAAKSFNRRWRFLGGDTHWGKLAADVAMLFQSQVAILGWGYSSVLSSMRAWFFVSIAGGDSWVGIPYKHPSPPASG